MKLPINPFYTHQSMPPDVDAAETENTLRAALPQAYAAETVSPELHQRIADMAALHSERQVMQPVRRPRLLLKLAMAGLIAIALPLFLAWPRLSTAWLLYRIQNAMLRTHDVHLVTWTIAPNGKTTRESEVWYRNGMWRVERSHRKIIDIRANKKPWIVDNYYNMVVLSRDEIPAYTDFIGFHLDASARDVARTGLRSRMEKVDKYTLAGQTIETYRLYTPLYPQKHVFVEINAQTDLPWRTIWAHEEKGRMKTDQITVFGFDEPNTPGMFKIKVGAPNGVQTIHFNAAKF
jgi:hypothetical protein